MKQTAVQWLADRLTVEVETRRLIRSDLTSKQVQQAVEEAKEMEQEQMIKFAELVASYPDKNRNAYGERLHAKSKYDGAERTVDLLEQYYNSDEYPEIEGTMAICNDITEKRTAKVSDEETEVAAKQMFYNGSDSGWHVRFARDCFKEGAKWMENQLKRRQ